MHPLKPAHSLAGRGYAGWSSAASGCKCCYTATTSPSSAQELDFSLDHWSGLGMRQLLLTPRYAKFEIRDRYRQGR